MNRNFWSTIMWLAAAMHAGHSAPSGNWEEGALPEEMCVTTSYQRCQQSTPEYWSSSMPVDWTSLQRDAPAGLFCELRMHVVPCPAAQQNVKRFYTFGSMPAVWWEPPPHLVDGMMHPNGKRSSAEQVETAAEAATGERRRRRSASESDDSSEEAALQADSSELDPVQLRQLLSQLSAYAEPKLNKLPKKTANAMFRYIGKRPDKGMFRYIGKKSNAGLFRYIGKKDNAFRYIGKRNESFRYIGKRLDDTNQSMKQRRQFRYIG